MVCDPKKIGGSQRKLMGGEGQKARAVVWQWVPTFKEAVPPPWALKEGVGGFSHLI